MALLKLDEQSMTLNAIAGAQEEYKPSDKTIVVSVKVQKLKEKMTAFCRCGASSNKPYCDGQHKQAGFEG